jgi:hypothetical protein
LLDHREQRRKRGDTRAINRLLCDVPLGAIGAGLDAPDIVLLKFIEREIDDALAVLVVF